MKKIAVILAGLILVVLVYSSPDESYWYKEKPLEAIELGRRFAYYLFLGYKQGLLKMSIPPAESRIKNSEWKELSFVNIDQQLENKRKNIHFSITAPLFSPDFEDIKLMVLERYESFIAITFAYEDYLGKIVEIPEKGKLLFSTVVRYYNPIDERIAPKLLRKIANLPILRYVTGKLGTTGRWVVIDYSYKFNQSDYLDWVLKSGEEYTEILSKKSDEFLDKVVDDASFDKLDESVDTSLSFLYQWGDIAIIKQMERIEKLDKFHQELMGKENE
jgi:hypothetical protein